MNQGGITMEIFNRKARHDYFILKTYEAGIELTGTEIKSIRQGSCNIKDSYAIIRNREETRTRRLLLHKKEIQKIAEEIEQKGLTLIPLKLYFKKNILKVELGICQGKHNYDKRESIKERDMKRSIEKQLKNRY